MKLSLGNRFHSSLFTLEVHLISFQKILKLLSSLTVPVHFIFLPTQLRSGKEAFLYYKLTYLSLCWYTTFYRNVFQILDEQVGWIWSQNQNMNKENFD